MQFDEYRHVSIFNECTFFPQEQIINKLPILNELFEMHLCINVFI